MKVKVIESKKQDIWGYSGDLLKGKIYTVEAIEKDHYRIIDESGEDYLYHKDSFEIAEELIIKGNEPRLFPFCYCLWFLIWNLRLWKCF